ncbi:unannotated protein [freshwater metagenome]|uniref:Unannotated protein n=1 Tax=freshwater metagenome TaxID=449393 RepID=A0A6J6YS36_9ZZZZ
MGGVIAEHEIESADDVAVVRTAVALKHLHGNQRHILGDAVHRAAEGGGDVGAVSVAVFDVGRLRCRCAGYTGEVDECAAHDAGIELGVRGVDARVNDIGGDA